MATIGKIADHKATIESWFEGTDYEIIGPEWFDPANITGNWIIKSKKPEFTMTNGFATAKDNGGYKLSFVRTFYIGELIPGNIAISIEYEEVI